MRFDFERRAAELAIKDLPGRLYTSLEGAVEWAKRLDLVDRKMNAYQTIKNFAFLDSEETKLGLCIRHKSSKKNRFSGKDTLLFRLEGWLDGDDHFSLIDLSREGTMYNGQVDEKVGLRLELRQDGTASAWFYLFSGATWRQLRVGIDRQGNPFITEERRGGVPRILLLGLKREEGICRRLQQWGLETDTITTANPRAYQNIALKFVFEVIGRDLRFNEIGPWFNRTLKKEIGKP